MERLEWRKTRLDILHRRQINIKRHVFNESELQPSIVLNGLSTTPDYTSLQWLQNIDECTVRVRDELPLPLHHTPADQINNWLDTLAKGLSPTAMHTSALDTRSVRDGDLSNLPLHHRLLQRLSCRPKLVNPTDSRIKVLNDFKLRLRPARLVMTVNYHPTGQLQWCFTTAVPTGTIMSLNFCGLCAMTLNYC